MIIIDTYLCIGNLHSPSVATTGKDSNTIRNQSPLISHFPVNSLSGSTATINLFKYERESLTHKNRILHTSLHFISQVKYIGCPQSLNKILQMTTLQMKILKVKAVLNTY